MPKMEKSIHINAPLERVFAFMAEPHNLLEIWPSLVEIKNVEPLPNGGFTYSWTYKMAGLSFQGQAEWTEFVKDQRIVNRNLSGIPSTFVWIYEPEDHGTRLMVATEYTIPGAALARLAEPVIQKLNEKEAESILINLKIRMESESQEVVAAD